MDLPSLAESIARKAHKGQTRRGGLPYISHVEAVVAGVESYANLALGEDKERNEDAKAVAWLHDVLEDTAITVSDLYNAGIPAHIVEAVEAMTKREGEPYGAYLNRVKANLLARIVKTPDMRHNSADKPSPRAATKYRAGIRFLAFGDIIDESRGGVGD